MRTEGTGLTRTRLALLSYAQFQQESEKATGLSGADTVVQATVQAA